MKRFYLYNSNWKQALVFPIMTTLQKLSNHLALLIPRSEDLAEKQLRDLEVLQTMVPERWKELYANRDSLPNIANPDFCGKVDLWNNCRVSMLTSRSG